MKQFTLKQIQGASGAVIIHPAFGTLYMSIKKVLPKKGIIEGLVWNETGYYQYNMPEDYHGEYEYMNFPFTCIKKLDFKPATVEKENK